MPFAAGAGRPGLEASLDAIFFDASNTKSFGSPEERSAFRYRWLGRYLEHDPDLAYLAWTDEAALAGYVVGCLDDPAQTRRFDDIGYFHLLTDLTAQFPAHLHINLAADHRGRGTGSRLIDAFAAAAAARGAAGVHIVTSHGARNVGFYLRNGFSERRIFPWKGRDLVMLARAL
jgi:ribosomal protein S18 acetylase RimI-like enzyme